MKFDKVVAKFKYAMDNKLILNLEMNDCFYTYVPGNEIMPSMLMKVDGQKVYASDGTKFVEVFN